MSYRDYLKSIGRKPIKGEIRAKRKPGDKEFGWHPDEGFITHVHKGEPEQPKHEVVPFRRRRNVG